MSVYSSVVITGAGGMLGQALAGALRSHGVAATTLSRAECDITHRADLNRAFEKRPTLLLNCAAFTRVDACEEEPDKADAINGYAVGNIAELCINHGTCLVHFSTDFVFDGRSRRPYQPEDRTNPLSVYGRSKVLGELQLQRPGLRDWLMVRTSWVYGRGGANFPRAMVTAARAGKPLSVVMDQTGAPTYAADLAAAILVLLNVGVRGIWHVTNSGQTNWFDFAKAALGEFGIEQDVKPLSSEQWRQMKVKSAARPAYSVLDIEPYAKIAGQPMRPWAEALKDYRAAVEREGF